MDTTAPSQQITGLVLAGGRGSRMGGVDKGLQMLGSEPLVWHALQRLRPQVGALAINANRHLEAYAGFGLPVWPDAQADFPGPLAGMLAGLARCETEWLVTVPCDTPRFPTDLVARLHAAAQSGGVRVAMPVTEEEVAGEPGTGHPAARPSPRPQPVFCLMHRSLRAALEAALAAGERKIERFTRGQGLVLVPFAEAEAFFNANTPDDLEHLRTSGGTRPSTPGSA
jgi:molybdopterin-guanine dinucleotide biosynthesis protein A